MATTRDDLRRTSGRDDRVVEGIDLEALWTGPTSREPAVVEATPAPRPADWDRRLLAAWLILMVSAVVAQPAPNPDATLPLWAEVLGAAFTAGLFATMFGLAARQPWGIKLSAATAVVAFGMAAACGITSHHPAAWWGYEMAATGALLALHRPALRLKGGT